VIYVHVIAHDSKAKPWVAVIRGASPRFGYSRTFVRPRRDYRHADERMRRTTNIRSCYLLEEGWVCELFEQCNHYDRTRDIPRYFARVTAEGLERISEDRVLQCLRERR
jgi:hypothetical protein